MHMGDTIIIHIFYFYLAIISIAHSMCISELSGTVLYAYGCMYSDIDLYRYIYIYICIFKRNRIFWHTPLLLTYSLMKCISDVLDIHKYKTNMYILYCITI